MEQIKNMRLYISFICLLAFSCASPVMAQKQSKVEKLLKFLVNNENEKFTKNRDKLDAETATAFEAEVKLIDLCDQIWNQQEVTVAKGYFALKSRLMATGISAVSFSISFSFSQAVKLTNSTANKVQYKQFLNFIGHIHLRESPIKQVRIPQK